MLVQMFVLWFSFSKLLFIVQLFTVKPVAPPTVPVPPPVHEPQPESWSSECTSSGESEVVTGTQGNASLPADSNNDGNRGVEV